MMLYGQIVEVLKAQGLGNEKVDEIVQQLWHQGFESDAHVLDSVKNCSDEQALVGRLMLGGFKLAQASSLAFAIQTIRPPSGPQIREYNELLPQNTWRRSEGMDVGAAPMQVSAEPVRMRFEGVDKYMCSQ